MSQVVQAKCPHCQYVLRIPEEWLSYSMRCKLCQKTFQASVKTSSSVSANVPIAQPAWSIQAKAPYPIAKPAMSVPIAQPAFPVPVAQPVGAVQVGAPVAAPPMPPSSIPFGFAEPEPPAASSSAPVNRRKRGDGLFILVLMFFFLFLLGASGVGFVSYKVYNLPPLKGKNDLFANGDGGRSDVPNGGANQDGPKAKDDSNKDKSIDPPPASDDGSKPKPKKTPNKDSVSKGGNAKKPPNSDGPFPRRALLISVNNYFMFSSVHYGSAPDPGRTPRYPGSSTAVLRDRLTRPPMNFPLSQVFELSDALPAAYKGVKAHSTQKSVLESTITDFVNSSRAQDRIILFYAGHAANLDNVSYLVPIDGKKDKPETLLPLKWVYDQLAACKAQQKILILDVFRFSPSRGLELPSPGEGDEGAMPEGFDKDLLTPPPGVQVWSSCLKGQSSVELDEGSAFAQALCNSLQGGGSMKGIATPAQPIQIEDFVADVNQRLKGLLEGEKRTQVSRLTGKGDGGAAAFDPSETLAPTLTFKQPTFAGGGDTAEAATIESILEELRKIQNVRDTVAGDLNRVKPQSMGAFSAKKIDGYKADGYQNVAQLQNNFKTGRDAFAKDFPLRSAYFETVEALDESSKLKMREVLGKAEADPKRKAAFLLEQAPLAISIFKLEGALTAMKGVAEKREDETSKRWQANFDYVHARLLSRLVYLYEYNFTLGQIRNDNLPELMGLQSGWRVGISGAKINVTEPKAKGYAKDTQKLWKRIQEEYPDTPWALLAQRESMIALGLAWKAKSD